MAKNKETKEIAIETLLAREKTKNRRIITGILIVAAFVAGFITSYFLVKDQVADVQAKAISTYSKVANLKTNQ